MSAHRLIVVVVVAALLSTPLQAASWWETYFPWASPGGGSGGWQEPGLEGPDPLRPADMTPPVLTWVHAPGSHQAHGEYSVPRPAVVRQRMTWTMLDLGPWQSGPDMSSVRMELRWTDWHLKTHEDTYKVRWGRSDRSIGVNGTTCEVTVELSWPGYGVKTWYDVAVTGRDEDGNEAPTLTARFRIANYCTSPADRPRPHSVPASGSAGANQRRSAADFDLEPYIERGMAEHGLYYDGGAYEMYLDATRGYRWVAWEDAPPPYPWDLFGGTETKRYLHVHWTQDEESGRLNRLRYNYQYDGLIDRGPDDDRDGNGRPDLYWEDIPLSRLNSLRERGQVIDTHGTTAGREISDYSM